MGVPSKSSLTTAAVSITVTRNLKSPVFLNPSKSVTIFDTKQVGDFVDSMLASDSDQVSCFLHFNTQFLGFQVCFIKNKLPTFQNYRFIHTFLVFFMIYILSNRGNSISKIF